VRKFLIFCSLWLGLTTGVWASETLTLADGSSVSGEIVKVDEVGAMIHTAGEGYTTVSIQWGQFSQASLKQLATNPKIQGKGYVDPFIEPAATGQPQRAIQVRPVERLKSPDELHPSLFGGLVHSSLGLFLLLLIYAANIYAGYEIAVVRGKALPVVIGAAAVLPLIGPIIFLLQPMTPKNEDVVDEGMPDDGGPAPAGTPAAGAKPGPLDEVQIVSASWQAADEEKKKPEAQVFSRGKFTFNKRFMETKFAGFIGEPKGEALKFSMEIKTSKGAIPVECIKQMAAAEAILETPTGQLTLAFGDIQEIKLIPKPA
jgi:hypothetical protein